MDIETMLKIDMVENMACEMFPTYNLHNKQSRLNLTPAQKKEVTKFLIDLGLQVGLRPIK